MRKILVILAILAASAISSSNARAQCAFDDSPAAPTLRGYMVRHYEPCDGTSIVFPAPNSNTGEGVPSCAPPFASSNFVFGPQNSARCPLRFLQTVEDPCSDGSGSPCSNIEIRARCRRVLNPDGTTPINGPGWNLVIGLTFTRDDPDNGDMTLISTVFTIPFPAAVAGDIGGTVWTPGVSTTTLLAGLGMAALPGCTSAAVDFAEVHDPSGNVFASLGLSRR
jgi:hypothetical protein